jgi:hypothetical protein
LLFCVAGLMLSTACGAAASPSGAAPTPDTGPSIAELSQRAVASATQAALARTAVPVRAHNTIAPAAESATLAGLLLSLEDLAPGYHVQLGPTAVNFSFNVGSATGGVDGWLESYGAAGPSGDRKIVVLEVVRYSGVPGRHFDIQTEFDSFLPSLNHSLADAGLIARAAPASFSVGDDSRGFTLSGSGGPYRGGAGVVFQRGDLLGVVLLAATPAPSSSSELQSLSQRQDAKLGVTLQ